MKSTNCLFLRVFWLAAFMAALSLLPACQREDSQLNDNVQRLSGPVSIDVTIDQEATQTSVSEMTGAISFSMGDKLVISDGEKIYKGITSSTSTSGMFVMEDGFNPGSYQQFGVFATFAGFPADMVSDISLIVEGAVQFNLPDSYWFNQVGGMDFNTAKVPCPMGGLYHAGGGISLKPVCSIVRFYITNVEAGTLTITFPTPVTGKAWVCPVTGDELSDNNLASSCPTEIQASGLTNSGNTVTIYDVPATKPGESLCVTIPVPVGTVPQNIVVFNGSTSDERIDYITGSSEDLTLGHGRRFMSFLKSRAFSISSSKRVVFSPGNLQYIGSASTPYWKFADHQWDILSTTTGQDSDATNVDRDLFGWATSGYNDKYPYMTSGERTDYGPAISSGEWTSDSAEWDWGVHNTISNGGGYSWHTPTKAEWEYLIQGRSYSPKCAKAVVAGVSGLILFPDNYCHPSGVAAIVNADAVNSSSVFTDNVFDETVWSSLESAGCVFLPAAGDRNRQDLDSVNYHGEYWSSTAASDQTSYFVVIFPRGVRVPLYECVRQIGCSVRLVRDVN